MSREVTLKRDVSFPMLTLYGLGTIIGAGIYVLVGEIAGHAGVHAPLAFLVAALVAMFTGFTYGELAARLPFSAGEAVYVNSAFNRAWLSALTGWAVAVTGVVSAAALINGFAGYLNVFVALPDWLVVVVVTLVLGGIAAWGIALSVWFAATMTLLSIGGLIWVLALSLPAVQHSPVLLQALLPSFEISTWMGIVIGGFVAFYAFVGFEDMVNIAEEVHHPEANIPRAIILALFISTLLYALVALVAVAALPLEQLTRSRAPLAEVMARHGPVAEHGIAALSLVSVLNGALVQIIMATRVLYGMANRGLAPARLGRVHPRTRTPLLGTLAVSLTILMLAEWLPVGTLAQLTSLVILMVFAVMHVALLRLKMLSPKPTGVKTIHPAIPVIGLVVSIAFILVRGFQLL